MSVRVILTETRVCEHCQSKFICKDIKAKMRQGGGRFCSFLCQKKWYAANVSPAARFAKRLGPIDENGCRLWLGHISSQGYGVIQINLNVIYAHRLAYTLAYGCISDDLCVLHKCDVRACVESTHLFAGTKLDNIEDMVKKGRHVRSTKRLSLQTVEIMRNQHDLDGMSIAALAKLHGVAYNTAHGIIRRRRRLKI